MLFDIIQMWRASLHAEMLQELRDPYRWQWATARPQGRPLTSRLFSSDSSLSLSADLFTGGDERESNLRLSTRRVIAIGARRNSMVTNNRS
jgi:hypothetical protein